MKMMVKHEHGKIIVATDTTTTTPVAEFMLRLGEEDPEGSVLQLSMAYKQEDQHEEDKSEGIDGQEKAESLDTDIQRKAEGKAPWVGKTWECKCENCVLPFWQLVRACN